MCEWVCTCVSGCVHVWVGVYMYEWMCMCEWVCTCVSGCVHGIYGLVKDCIIHYPYQYDYVHDSCVVCSLSSCT